MVQPDSQWLYVITDSVVRNTTNITNFIDLLSEGANVAFIYNSTDNDTYCDVIWSLVQLHVDLNRLKSAVNGRIVEFARKGQSHDILLHVAFFFAVCFRGRKVTKIVFQAKLLCHVQELVAALANAIKLSLIIEIELYNRVSEEEFELVRLSKRERRREILKNIRVRVFEYRTAFRPTVRKW